MHAAGNHTQGDAHVDALLQAGASAMYTNQSGMSALLLAVRRGSHHAVRALMAAGADANQEDCKGCTPLMLASIGGYKDVEELLISHGARPSSNTLEGYDAAAVTLANMKVSAQDLVVGAYSSRLAPGSSGGWSPGGCAPGGFAPLRIMSATLRPNGSLHLREAPPSPHTTLCSSSSLHLRAAPPSPQNLKAAPPSPRASSFSLPRNGARRTVSFQQLDPAAMPGSRSQRASDSGHGQVMRAASRFSSLS